MLRIMEEKELINFVLPEKQPTIIKVVGVGGGGGNAVNHMFNEGIRDVSYLICNTDQQVLFTSPIPDKLQLGPETTHGLGAGNKPAVAKQAAEESEEDIRRALGDSTKMVFITAGMGGGTGTGAAPVIAKISRSMDILTVGIVTIPFSWEGAVKINQAMDGVDAISKEVDALLVINNDLLSTIYPDMTVMNGFKKADDTLCTAAKSIAEIITIPGYINLDFADVKTVLKDGGVAVMSAGKAKGKNRVIDAMNEALRSPLLNNNDVFQASKILFNISCGTGKHELVLEETQQINKFMEQFEDRVQVVIWGISIDESLGEELKVTLLASGFGVNDVPAMKQYHQQEENKNQAEQEETRIRRDNQIRSYYGKAGVPPRRFYCTPFVMSEEDLNNDALIERLSEEPANQRTKNME